MSIAGKEAGDTWSVGRIKRPQSLMSIVSNKIRELIVSGEISLGELISENDLVAKLGVSRTPVREALQRLEDEGLVEIVPQRGTFVFAYDEKALRDTTQLRQILEAGALRIALMGDRDELIDRLRKRLRASEEALPKGVDAFRPTDAAFHTEIVQASGNQDLIEAYDRISHRIRALLNRLTRTNEEIAGSLRAHSAIVQSIENRDDNLAEEQLKRHVFGLVEMYAS